MPNDEQLCKHCGGEIRIRNPTGKCDHLYWPDELTDEAKIANGIPIEPSRADREDGCSVYFVKTLKRPSPKATFERHLAKESYDFPWLNQVHKDAFAKWPSA